MKNIAIVLQHVTAAREAIGQASAELRAGLTEAEVQDKTVMQLIDSQEVVAYEMLSTALMLQHALQEVIYLTSELHREKREQEEELTPPDDTPQPPY